MTEVVQAIDAATDDDWFEIIEGVKIMAASARGGHNAIASRIFAVFDNYFFDKGTKAFAFPDIDVYLPDGNIFRPDLCVITDPKFIGKDDKIHGAPDLVVEVLSPSTMNNDLGIKKVIYERNGVKEYWIVDPISRNVYVYNLVDGRYNFDAAYHAYSRDEFDSLTDEERAEVKDKIQVGIFPELFVDVNFIFRRWFN